MAQYTVSLDPRVMMPDGTCTIRVATSAPGLYTTFVVRDGETLRTDDPVTIRALNELLVGPTKCVNTLAIRPANPTHDLDSKTREPLPTSGRKDPG